MPVGHWSPFLPAALRSLQLQNAPLQVALCDASGDPRVATAADASGVDFIYRRHGPDEGQSGAIAEGWSHTTGALLGWLNADDVLLPGALDDVAGAFEANPSGDVWFGQSTFFNSAGTTIGRHPEVEPVSDLLLRSNTISQPSCFARRTSGDAVGGVDRRKHFTMDWDLWARLYRSGAKFGCSRRFYSAVLMSENTKTNSISRRRLAEIFDTVSAGATRYTAAKSVIGSIQRHMRGYADFGALPLGDERDGMDATEALRESHARTPARATSTTALPVVNLSDRDQRRLVVVLAGRGAEHAEVTANGHSSKGAHAEFFFDPPVRPGAAPVVSVRGRPDHGVVQLKEARWGDKAAPGAS
ncbi:MAG: glycosyltransferase [Maricaulaceae bacterium]